MEPEGLPNDSTKKQQISYLKEDLCCLCPRWKHITTIRSRPCTEANECGCRGLDIIESIDETKVIGVRF